MRNTANLGVVAVAVIAGGCTSETELMFSELEAVPRRDELVDVELGSYAVPVPLRTEERGERRNCMEFQFALYAGIPPEDVPRARAAWRRCQGQFRDCVIGVCRGATLDEFNDEALTALKSKLLDAVRPYFKGVTVQQLTIANHRTNPL